MSTTSSSDKASGTEQEKLRANTIGLPGVLFQSITTMAPASGLAFSLGAALPYAGAALPLAAVITLIIAVLIALNIGALAKHLPSAGGFFTYIGHTMGPQAGWMVGWLFDFAYLLIVPFQLLVLGPVADSFANQYLHLSFGPAGWAIWAVIFAIIIFGLTYFGIKVSADVGVILGAIEIVVFVVLSIWLIVAAGPHNSLAPFNPASSLQHGLGGWQGVLFGMIFVVLAFAGFESSAPLAEEAQDPRRTVPRAIVLAATGIGIFYVFCSYAGVVGWGVDNIAKYTGDLNGWTTLANRVWGPVSLIIPLAILNSALANSNAAVNAVTRVLYAMGRTKTLPAPLAHLNRYQTPDVAVILTMVIAVVFALLPGFLYDPNTGFALLGTIVGLPIIFVYLATCAAVPIYYLRERRDEFTVLRHIIVPVIPIIVLLIVLVFQFNPLPPAPLNMAGPIFVLWFVIGLVIVFLLSKNSPEALSRITKLHTDDVEEGEPAVAEA
ncbi:APC family permease [Ktedonosporobacter rubrisoli]|uniref:APC family permease n=1 Tax=Ktedonosporobacter rubrisoli TaxID=2509675 RepID=A0A4P6JWA1_KTERU|nr:APC family permease [Ktedonosporobacter rubrisoli]QBD79650.1 APC family permease [Ktedonosporobacter rubrisoli]